MNFSANLNTEQKDAVNTIEGPVLVLAGAGSGKTRVVTCRMATLIDMGVPASQILGLTFTNKAAEEMRERVNQMVGRSSLLVCTFHSLGARILRESIHALGYTRDFIIYDEDDADKVIQTCLTELEIKDKKMDVKTFRGLISRAKNAILLPGTIKTCLTDSPAEAILPRVYELYQTKLKHYNAVDFDDLLFMVVRLFKEHPAILELYQNRWSFMLIDEYQDTNEAQYTILKYLSAKHHNLFVVGDPDQSIYSWRGANIHNILNFEKDFSGAKIFRLEQNYRSHTNILQAANALIGNNENRYEKALWSNLGEGEKIKFYASDTEREEAEFVAERIRRHHENGVSYSDMVIFYRTNNQSRAFEDHFLYKRIPYVIVGGLSFYQRREIKDILSFLRMVYSGTDYISFARSVNLPKRGLGEATLEKIRLAASAEQMSVFTYCEAIVRGDLLQHPIKLPTKQREGLIQYLSLIHNLREIGQNGTLHELVRQTIETTNYLQILREDPESFEDRKGNLDALITKAIEWEEAAMDKSLRSFLEELSLKSSLDEADTKKDKVNLMTIHNGKGLEFKITFLVGLEEDLFPHVNSKDNPSALEEERRLCYVGMTRAKEQLYMTYSQFRYMWGMQKYQIPSRFIREVPSQYIENVKKTFIRAERPIKLVVEEVAEADVKELENEPFYTYDVGSSIYHKDFGIGIIKDTSQSSLGLTYKIFFSKDNRERSIVAKYAKLKKL
jgi:DNA helicase II / ATP-dependent DNA helicase PcrA